MALIHYYQGSMYAGKSTQAVNTLLQAKEYQQKIIISPSWHSRGFLSRNHTKESIPSDLIILASYQDLHKEQHLGQKKTLMLIDEVQFYPKENLADLLSYAQDNLQLDLIIAGLQVGQHGMPFSNHDLIMHYFHDKITKIYAPCAICDHPQGLVAVRKWLINDHIKDEYSLLCKACFDKFFAYGRGHIAIPDPSFE